MKTTLIVLCGVIAALSCSPADAGLFFRRFARQPSCAACQVPQAKKSDAKAAGPKYEYRCDGTQCYRVQVK